MSRADRLDTMRSHYYRNLEVLGIETDEMGRMMREALDTPNDMEMALASHLADLRNSARMVLD
jgi:hypothetical protein